MDVGRGYCRSRSLFPVFLFSRDSLLEIRVPPGPLGQPPLVGHIYN
jgi:hypothetical protein